jgi:hypothetical protein
MISKMATSKRNSEMAPSMWNQRAPPGDGSPCLIRPTPNASPAQISHAFERAIAEIGFGDGA